jgi:hypothetical protein
VLGDTATSRSDNDRAGGGGIEAFPGEAAGTACIEQGPVRHNLACVLSHDGRAGCQLVSGFTAHRQTHQECADLFRHSVSGQKRVERAFQHVVFKRLTTRERF